MCFLSSSKFVIAKVNAQSKPAIFGTFSVPALAPLSCSPPNSIGFTPNPYLIIAKPTPFGP